MTFMGNYDRDRNSSGGRTFGRRDFGNRDGARPMLHKTICSKCGKECEVPFRPTGNRPVYCKECFQTIRPEATRPDNNFSRRPNFENRGDQVNRSAQQPQYEEQLEALSAKLDKILRILESKVVAPANSIIKKVKIPKAKKTIKKSTSSKKE
jgi:CxxC-x17-CxxC domain-containing protein